MVAGESDELVGAATFVIIGMAHITLKKMKILVHPGVCVLDLGAPVRIVGCAFGPTMALSWHAVDRR